MDRHCPAPYKLKVAQGASGFWLLFGKGTLEWLRGFTIQGSSPIFTSLPAIPNATRFILFIVVGIPATLAFFRFQILPLTWGALYALAYYLLNVPFYHWYIVPIVLALMIAAAAGVAGVVELTRRIYHYLSGSHYRSWVVSLLVAVCCLALSPGLWAEVRYTQNRAANEPNPSEVLYERTGEWLKANTRPADRIGYLEIGYLGYYSQRPIIDALGLVTPEVASHIASGDFSLGLCHLQAGVYYHQSGLSRYDKHDRSGVVPRRVSRRSDPVAIWVSGPLSYLSAYHSISVVASHVVSIQRCPKSAGILQ